MSALDEDIIKACRQAERDLRRAVLPYEVLVRMPYPRAEGSLRRDMVRLWREGRLYRLGGPRGRQGYIVM